VINVVDVEDKILAHTKKSPGKEWEIYKVRNLFKGLKKWLPDTINQGFSRAKNKGERE
jgi:hypothetical protein